MSRPPVILLPAPTGTGDVEGPPGWAVHDGFALPDRPWDLSSRRRLCVGTVATPDDAEAAVTALARGAGLAVAVAVEGDLRHRLLEDLHRAGDVRPAPGADTSPALDAEQQALLDAVAGGATVDELARRLHVSRRTVHRRMAAIRERLGVATTAEAVTRSVRRR